MKMSESQRVAAALEFLQSLRDNPQKPYYNTARCYTAAVVVRAYNAINDHLDPDVDWGVGWHSASIRAGGWLMSNPSNRTAILDKAITTIKETHNA